MKQIVDVGTRQIQPKDLSFLSEADFGIIKALGGAILLMSGYLESDAVILSGLKVDTTYKPGLPRTCKVSAGVVLYNGNLYSVDAVELSINAAEEANNLVLSLNSEATIAPPSPVYDKDLSKTKKAHLEWKGYVSFNQNLVELAWRFTALNNSSAYPVLKRIFEYQKVQTQAIAVGD